MRGGMAIMIAHDDAAIAGISSDFSARVGDIRARIPESASTQAAEEPLIVCCWQKLVATLREAQVDTTMD